MYCLFDTICLMRLFSSFRLFIISIITTALFVSVMVFVPVTPAHAASLVKIGVFTSADSIEFSALVGVTRVPSFENGWFDVLYDAGLDPQWVVAEDASDALLADFDVLVMPFTIALGKTQSVAVLDWVRAGGGLIVEKGSPRVFYDVGGSAPGPYEYWFREYGGSVFEWGPLSAAYQKDLINDPTPWDYSVLSTGTHPIIQRTLAATGLSSLKLDRPNGAGAEFTVPLAGNSNTVPLFTYDVHSSTSVEGVDPRIYDGFQAAEAIRYGFGRLVYWDFLLVDFLVHSDGFQPAGNGLQQKDVARELALQSVSWVSESDGVYAVQKGVASVSSVVAAYSTVIVLNSKVANVGNASLVGDLYMRVLDPSGRVVFSQQRDLINLAPGDFHEYSVSYKPGKRLSDGLYTVEFWFASNVPDYVFQGASRTFVKRSQGKNIKSSQVAPSLVSSGTQLLVGYRPATGVVETLIGSSNFGASVFAGGDTFESGSFGGAPGSDLVVYDSSSGNVNYLFRNLSNWSVLFDGSWSRGWSHVVAGDFDGNGVGDMLFYRASDGLIVFYTITASGRFIPLTDVMHGSRGWSEIVAGDFNGNGSDDVLWYRASDGVMRFYQVSSTGVFKALTPVLYGNHGWDRIPSADFDGDGKDDVLWYRSSDGLARVYSIEGSRHVPLGPAFHLTRNADALEAGDFLASSGSEVALLKGSQLTVLDFSDGVFVAKQSTSVVAGLLIAAVDG